MMPSILKSAAFCLAVATTTIGCSVATQSTPIDDVGKAEGKLSVSLTVADDVSGFSFEIADEKGTIVDTRYVALEAETLDPTLVGSPAGALGAAHRFADALFVLPSGTYKVKATPMASEKTPSMLCEPATGSAMVSESATTEIVLVSACKAKQNGALDVVAVLDHPAQITDLKIQGSKFAGTCECVTATVTAADPDGDEVSYDWKVVTMPNGAQYDTTKSGNTFNFKAHTPGNYEVKVTACDAAPEPLCSSLTFPLHISGKASDCVVAAQALDMIIAIDTTGSMDSHIQNIRDHIHDLLNAIPIGNYRYAVVDYRDFPENPYGSPGDFVYHKDLDFVTDHLAVEGAINALAIAGGGDAPEAVYSALIQSINNVGFTSPWRPEAAKAIVLIGDGAAHDPEPHTGYTLADLKAAANAAHVRILTIAATHGSGWPDPETVASFKAIASSADDAFETTEVIDTAPKLGAAIGKLTAESICPAPTPTM